MHAKTDVVRTYTYTVAELQEKLGFGGDPHEVKIAAQQAPMRSQDGGSFLNDFSFFTLTILTTEVHPEDARHPEHARV